MGSIFVSCLVWIAALSVVGIVAGWLISFGIPAQYASLIAIGMLMAPIFAHQSDRYMLQRWKRKFKGWVH